MFDSLTGDIECLVPGSAVVHCGDVGYAIAVPLSTYEYLKATNAPLKILTYLQIGETVLKLYGFYTSTERTLFLTLIGIHGVGPSMALRILSGMPAAEFSICIRSGDEKRLKQIKGVGAKLASRLVVELKDKLGTALTPVVGSVVETICAERDSAIAGMESLGYKKTEAAKVIDKVIGRLGNGLSAEELVTEGLQNG